MPAASVGHLALAGCLCAVLAPWYGSAFVPAAPRGLDAMRTHSISGRFMRQTVPTARLPVAFTRLDDEEEGQGARVRDRDMERGETPLLEGKEVEATDEEIRTNTMWEVSQDEDGKPRFKITPQFSAFDDLWPVIVAYVKGIMEFDAEGTKRRQAQVTIVSITGLAAAMCVLFIGLLPAGIIHNADSSTTTTRATYRKRTYVDPNKMLEEDFYRAGGVYLDDWARTYDEDDF